MFDQVKTRWVEVRAPSGRLICRIDAARGLLEWREGRERAVIDLVGLLAQGRGAWAEGPGEEEALDGRRT